MVYRETFLEIHMHLDQLLTVRAETHSELIPAARKIEFESCK